MWRYIRRYLPFAILAGLFMIGEVSMDLIQPSIMSQIVDDGVLGLNNNGIGDLNLSNKRYYAGADICVHFCSWSDPHHTADLWQYVLYVSFARKIWIDRIVCISLFGWNAGFMSIKSQSAIFPITGRAGHHQYHSAGRYIRHPHYQVLRARGL